MTMLLHKLHLQKSFHVGDLFRLHLSDPVLATLSYIFSSNLKLAQNFDMTVVASQFL